MPMRPRPRTLDLQRLAGRRRAGPFPCGGGNVTGPTPELAAWHARIAASTNVAKLLSQRLYIVSEMPKATAAGHVDWLVMAVDARNRIDRRLSELGVDTETPASRKTGARGGRKIAAGRARGYIANYAPQAKTLVLLNDADAVLDEYREHWPLTCRQIFYRLIGAYGYDKTDAFYDRLCHHLANARRGRRIAFDAIRDDGVTTVRMQHFDDEEHLRAHQRKEAEGYRRNLLATQPLHVEVWCEASGMVFQLADVTQEFSIRVYSSSGFDSLTAKKELADRICRDRQARRYPSPW
jgi:hypothetical protein